MPRMTSTGARPHWDRLYDQAVSQSGYFTFAQALGAGYSSPLLEYHIRKARVERVERGIFRLVHFPPSEHEDLVVAWLWSCRRGVFSHQTALQLHGLSDALPAKKHMTVPESWRKRRLRVPPGLLLHYADLLASDIGWVNTIPVTGAARTVLDCARDHVPPDLVTQALRQLARRGVVSGAQFRRLLADDRQAAKASAGRGAR